MYICSFILRVLFRDMAWLVSEALALIDSTRFMRTAVVCHGRPDNSALDEFMLESMRYMREKYISIVHMR